MYLKSIQKREYHLGALLVIAVACCQCIPTGSGFRPVKALWDFVQLAAFPALVFLFGSLSRELANTRERLIRYAMAFGELYLVQKLLIYWVQAAMGGTPSLQVLSASGAPWFFLVIGAYLLLMLGIEKQKWNRNAVILISVAIGCLAGLASWIGDTLCLARMLVYLPFFLLGRWTDSQRRDQFLSRAVVKIGALAGVLAVLAVCYWKADYIYRLAAFFDGNKRYAALSSGIIGRFGPIVRLGWYALALCLIFGLLALIPNRKLSALTRTGSGWAMAYFWQNPIALVFSTLLMKGFSDRLGKKGYAIGLVLALVLMVITFLPGAVRPVQWLFRHANFWDPPAPYLHLEAEGKGSFYKRHWRGIQYTLVFTGIFLVLSAAITLPLFQGGRSMVWQVDGLHQQYSTMMLLGEYLRVTVKEFLSTGVLRLNQYTFQAGLGMSVLDVVRKDPLLLLCGFVTGEHMEALYAILCLLRMYLSGLAFIWLCLELNRSGKTEVVCGALSFAFCGFSIYIMIRQPSFQTPCMIYLPLMLTGVERFLKKRKGGLFLVTVCLSMINGYYLAYMNTLLMALYLLVRLIFLYGKEIKTIVSEILKLIGVYIWGTALSAVVLLPTLYSYLTCSRTGEQTGSTAILFYSENYYKTLLNELLKGCPNSCSYWAALSFPALTLLAMVLLFFKKDKKFRPLKTGVIICVVMICVPLFGRIMNGFGYVTNRWCYGFELMASLVLVYTLPEFLHLSRREKQALLIVGAGYIGLVLCGTMQVTRYAGLLTLAVTLLAVLSMEAAAANNHQKKVLLSVTMTLALVVNLGATFRTEEGNYAGQCLPAGEVQNTLEDSPVSVADTIEDDSFYRVEQPARRSNQAIAMGYYGTTSYFSVIPAGLTEFYLDFNLNTAQQSFDLRGFDSRAGLEALGSVKYYLTKTERVPYGFQQVDEQGGYRVYENQYALPLGYTYTSYMTETDYNQLNFAEKQQAILQNAVVSDDAALEALEQAAPRLTVQELDWEITDTDGVTLDQENRTIRAEKEGASITFSFDGIPDSETYLYLEGIGYANPNSSALSRVRVDANDVQTETRIHGKKQTYYFDTTGFSFNLGYQEEGTSECTVSFDTATTYSYEAFRIFCLPIEDYVNDVTALGEEVMENIVEDGDTITGTISASSTRLLTFSIPYSKGWSLYVDGEKTPLIQVDKLFMGAVIQPGDHELELHYTTPWLNYGLIASGAAAGAILLRVIYVLLFRGKTRKGKQK